MNKLVSILAALAACALTGCASYPSLQCDHWQHQGGYGVFTTNYEATGVTKQADGSLKVATYSGSVKVLGGYGVSDTIQGLVLTPAQADKAAPQQATSLNATESK